MHGFNDSIKKTNTQRVLSEFISLVSFNGQMTYPQIKKVKEVGMNTSCTGYQDDVNFALSRCAEAVRIGVDHVTSYMMLRIHLVNILRSYSMLPNMLNNMYTNKTASETPIELFGYPDILPFLYFMVNGNPNNYRILNFGDVQNRTYVDKALQYLLSKEIKKQEENDFILDESPIEKVVFYSPTYIYDQENKLIKNIRSLLDTKSEDAKNFFDEHKSYNYMKPINKRYKKIWLEGQYYKPTFSIAYSRISRAALTLRLSRLTRNKCIVIKSGDSEPEVLTILQYQKKIIREIHSYNSNIDNRYKSLFKRMTYSNDPTVELIYNMLINSSMVNKGSSERELTACLTPIKPKWFQTANPTESLFQYIFNYDDLLLDGREIRGLPSLASDKKRLEEMYNMKLDKDTNYLVMSNVFKDITMNKGRQNICMIPSSSDLKFENFIKTSLELQTMSGINFELVLRGNVEAQNPYDSKLYYKKDYFMVRQELRLCLDDMCLLYGLLKHGLKLEKTQILSEFKQLKYSNNLTGESFFVYNMFESSQFNNFLIQEPKSYELKEFAFLKWALFDDSSSCYDLMEHVSSYTYKYFKHDAPLIKESVYINYQRDNFVAVLNKNDEIIIFGETKYKFRFLLTYIIALRLFNKISAGLFDTQLGRVNVNSIKKIKKQTVIDSIEQLPYIHKNYFDDRWMEIPIDKLETQDEDNILPFIFSPDIEVLNNVVLGTLPKVLEINEETSTVLMGGLKYFTCPYLQSSQSGVLETDSKLTLNGLN